MVTTPILERSSADEEQSQALYMYKKQKSIIKISPKNQAGT